MHDCAGWREYSVWRPCSELFLFASWGLRLGLNPVLNHPEEVSEKNNNSHLSNGRNIDGCFLFHLWTKVLFHLVSFSREGHRHAANRVTYFLTGKVDAYCTLS